MTLKMIKKVLFYIVPLLLFAVLFIPYNFVNQALIVDIFGCGCPEIDELGNMVRPDFNANDFTALFWLVITVCATVMAVFISEKLPKKMFRLLYITGIFAVSLLISYLFYQMMMWN